MNERRRDERPVRMPNERHDYYDNQNQHKRQTSKLTLYAIETNHQGVAFWNRVGVGFLNRDGSVNIKLDMFPGLTLQLRADKEKGEVVR